MLKTEGWRGALLCVAAAGCMPAHAGRPLNTDNADTLATTRCELEPYETLDRRSGVSASHTRTLQGACALTVDSQLGLSHTTSWSSDDAQRAWGVSGKTRLIAPSGGATAVSVGYGLTVAKDGASWSRDLSVLYLIATRPLAPRLIGHLNVGTSHSRRERQQRTIWAAALEWAVAPPLTLSAEGYGDDRARPWAGAGLNWLLRQDLSVNVSAGAQASTPGVRQLSMGMRVEF